MQVKDKKGFLLSLVLIAIIAAVFWTQSRFPALDQKAQMGQRTHISALAFDVIFPLDPEQSTFERVAYSALNWAYTNWKGMMFGFLLAAALLSAMKFLTINSASGPPSHWKDSFKGALVGSPLGVCANCSTPIAFGLYRGGVSVATSLSMLSSSPTFNFIVVSMSLALLPLELVLVKYAFAALFIFVVIPLILKHSGPINSGSINGSVTEGDNTFACAINLSSTWTQAFQIVCQSFLTSLWRVVKETLPFMLLAGVLAAFLAEFAPLDMLIYQPEGTASIDSQSIQQWTLFALLCVSLLSALFPVPIAFDVIISVGLMAMGVGSAYLGASYFALGIFSIYPAMMVARDLSVKLSLYLMLSVVLMAALAGIVTHQLMAYQQDQQFRILTDMDEGSISEVAPDTDPAVSAIDYTKSKPMMRQAARLCHRLGEPAQYQCFERFVLQTLSAQFGVEVCEYLEDARVYRQTCEQSFQYLAASRKARQGSSIKSCAVLPDSYRVACEYDVAFERATDSQDLSSCLMLIDEHSKQRCIDESITMNLELYGASDDQAVSDGAEAVCQRLKKQPYIQNCTDFIRQRTQEKVHIYQNDLSSCLVFKDLKLLRSCQGVIMVNQLEQGAEVGICEQVQGEFLQQRCHEFHLYLQIIPKGSLGDCEKLTDSSLEQRCVLESIQLSLSRQQEALRYEYLSEVEGVLASDIDKSDRPVKARSSQADDLIKKGQVFELKVVEKSLNLSSVELKNSSLDIKSYPFQSRNVVPKGSKAFKKVSAASIGLLASPAMKMTELFEPFSYGRGISSGDINRDNWPDLVVAYADHVKIYQNMGGVFNLAHSLNFNRATSPILVALADLNSDGWPDLLVSFYGGENRIYLNKEGIYDEGRYTSIFPANSQLTMSVGFADPDLDGDLDMVLGSWSFGDLRHFNPAHSQNYFAENITPKGEYTPKFKLMPLKGAQGESLSVLVSDLNHNGQSDVFIGNDMDGPDVFYQWRNNADELADMGLPSNSDHGLPAISSFNTLSIDSGDFNRDLKLDYYSVDMSFSDSEGIEYCEVSGIDNKPLCDRLMQSEQALRDGSASWCLEFEDQLSRKDCLNSQIIQLAKQSQNQAYCEKIPVADKNLQRLCQAASIKLPPKAAISLDKYPKNIQKNVLMISGENGFTDQASEWNASESYWSWNAKIADLDNDGWQDVYIGNGYLFGGSGRHLHSNVFLRNKGGKHFERAEAQYGLDDYLNTPSFTYIDYDQDGDLDIISNRVAANAGVFVNHSDNKAIRFTLHDPSRGLSDTGQNAVVGSKIIINYGSSIQSEKQIKEVKLSGGFLSFDEPVGQFGLGVSSGVSRVEIEWLDGEVSVIDVPLKAGFHYHVYRNK